MLAQLALLSLVAAVAPSNEEVGTPPQIVLGVLGAALGALVIGTTAGAVTFVYFTDACASDGCVDDPAYTVAPIATIAGATAGGIAGAVIGIGLANVLGTQTTGSTRPQVNDHDRPLPDE